MSWEQQLTARLGADGIRRLVAAFYRRIRKDDLIGPMYPQDDWEGSERRLADFLCFRITGDETYMETRGHPRLRMRHVPFKIGIPERDRWMKLMEEAMDEEKVDRESRSVLKQFLGQVADMMRNQP